MSNRLTEPNVKERVVLAADIEPELNAILAGKTIQRVTWHDGHGDVIILHLNDNTQLSICTSLNVWDKRVKPDGHKLYMEHRFREPTA